ncbi:type II toxin-antitoxin system HicB family antitoxin [Microbispora triticiradicis]|uniref:Prevent-host-death protein n=2 Tax=Microbispora TaxID=2005 RepID=A0ABY3LT63_9ACTN|nr:MULTISPECIES: prevent-host-death protein [Microbispora]TLP62026.1 prevent-host-death protein [Microbispora fusca]TYB51288.1 prevent-host-death protein [Microbispora tritici]
MGAHLAGYREALARLGELLDAAERGRSATVRCGDRTVAVVDRHALARIYPSKVQVVAEESGWSAFIPGLPVAADGSTFDEAIGELLDALREYAEDWQDHLSDAPDHRDNWGLMQMICLSSDAQLRQWLVGVSP